MLVPKLSVKCEMCSHSTDFNQAVTYTKGSYGYAEELFMVCKSRECLSKVFPDPTEEQKQQIEKILKG